MRPDIEAQELAWAAGFFDGEGWVGFNYQYPRISVGQRDERPLIRFQVALGLGKIYPIRTRPGAYQWVATGMNAFEAFNKLYPLLCEPKRQQGKELFSWHRRQVKRGA